MDEQEKWLEEQAKDIGGGSVEELRRMQRWDDLLLIQFEYQFPLEGREGFRICADAAENLHLLADAALNQHLFGDNEVMIMLITEAWYRAEAMRERLRAEIEESEGSR